MLKHIMKSDTYLKFVLINTQISSRNKINKLVVKTNTDNTTYSENNLIELEIAINIELHFIVLSVCWVLVLKKQIM